MINFYRKIIFVLIVCFIAISGYAQNFIGQHKQDIRQKVKEAYPGFNFDKEVVNGKKSFLKYINTLEEQTLLLILDENGICTSTARMYNSWLFSKIKGELDKKYKRKDSLTWQDFINGNEYDIYIKKGNWFFTVITRQKKQ